MARFSDYLDEYPGVLPGDLGRPDLSEFDLPSDRGKFFEKFLALQQNPTGAILSRLSLPDRFKQFMSLSG